MLTVSFGLIYKRKVDLKDFRLVQYFVSLGPANYAEQFLESVMDYDDYTVSYSGMTYHYAVSGATVSFVPSDRDAGEDRFRRIVWNAYSFSTQRLLPAVVEQQKEFRWLKPSQFTVEYWDVKQEKYAISNAGDVDRLVQMIKG